VVEQHGAEDGGHAFRRQGRSVFRKSHGVWVEVVEGHVSSVESR
jgi:hypothetical protein